MVLDVDTSQCRGLLHQFNSFMILVIMVRRHLFLMWRRQSVNQRQFMLILTILYLHILIEPDQDHALRRHGNDRRINQMWICRRRKIMSPERLHVADENWNVLDHKMMIGEGGAKQGDGYQGVIDLVKGMNQCNMSIEMNSIHLFLLFLLQMTLLWRILDIVHMIVHDRMMMSHL